MKYLHIVNFCVLLSLCLSKAFIEAAPTNEPNISPLDALDFRNLKNISIFFDSLERIKITDCNLLRSKVDEYADSLLTRPSSAGKSAQHKRAWDKLEPVFNGPDGIRSILEPRKEQLVIACELIKRPEDWNKFKTAVSQHVPIKCEADERAFDEMEVHFKDNPSMEQTFLRFKNATLEASRRDEILTKKVAKLIYA